MKIVITGSSGLIGKFLVEDLKQQNHTIIPLVHDSNKRSDKKDFIWNIFSKKMDIKAFENVDCVIHLAGSSISKRWSKSHKDSIYHSRIDGTNLLFEMFKKHQILPKHFISASAIGYYPDPQLEKANENTPKGNGFLANVCADWESSVLQFESLGIQTSIVRTGLVLANVGGIYPCMGKTRKLGIAPTTGNPNNYWSWIHVQDMVKIYTELVNGQLIPGIYNAVSPHIVTQGEIMKSMLHQTKLANQSLFPFQLTPNIPPFLLKLLLGEQSILTLTNQNIVPQNLLNQSFQFNFPTIDSAMKNLVHGK